MNPRGALGQVLAEYLVVCSALAMALLLPQVGNVPVGVWLVRSLIGHFRALTFVMSVI